MNEIENEINNHLLYMSFQIYHFCDIKKISLKYDSIRCHNILKLIIKKNNFGAIGNSLEDDLKYLYELELKLNKITF
jgi:hypothetical protein